MLEADLTIRESGVSDLAGIEAFYPAAFPDEDLLPLIRNLMALEKGMLSLVAEKDGVIAGHVIFTDCKVGESQVALLGPLAVAPDFQKQGVGSALIRTGFERLAKTGAGKVMVLGDRGYYGRFGFAADGEVTPPYEIPKDWDPAWQSISLAASEASVTGQLQVPKPWQHRSYWAP